MPAVPHGCSGGEFTEGVAHILWRRSRAVTWRHGRQFGHELINCGIVTIIEQAHALDHTANAAGSRRGQTAIFWSEPSTST